MCHRLPTLISLLALLFAGCAEMEGDDFDQDNTDKIIGGRLSKGFLPVVGLKYYGEIDCTGTLITKRSVLTAAHCLESTSIDIDFEAPDQVVFSRGETVKKEINVTGYAIHQGYIDSKTEANDLAIIYLAEDAPVEPIKTFRGNLQKLHNKIVTIVGYGEFVYKKSRYYGVKYQAKMKLIDHDHEFVYVESNNSKHKSSCYGDSGGPILMRNNGKLFVMGVLSTGSTLDCGPGDVSWYTRIDDERSWINAHKHE